MNNTQVNKPKLVSREFCRHIKKGFNGMPIKKSASEPDVIPGIGWSDDQWKRFQNRTFTNQSVKQKTKSINELDKDLEMTGLDQYYLGTTPQGDSTLVFNREVSYPGLTSVSEDVQMYKNSETGNWTVSNIQDGKLIDERTGVQLDPRYQKYKDLILRNVNKNNN